MTASRALVVTAAVTALVTSLALSAQASGGGWIRLGGHNDAVRTTTVDDHGRGPALRLRTRRGVPPLAVTSSRRVARLNADRVDGMQGQALVTHAYIYEIGGDEDWGPNLDKSFPGLPPGYYLVSYQMKVRLYNSGVFSCWFTTPTQSQAGNSSGSAGDYQTTVLTGNALVDARKGITLHCEAGPAFDTIDSSNTGQDSRAIFLRTAPSQLRQASTK
jgi:hypothetical protein